MQKQQPKISVLMACFREPVTFVREAIESVLGQTNADFEFIVVLDDPENQEIVALLDAYAKKDNRIRVIRHDKARGLAAARNTGITAARGEYIALMDADDIMLSNRLERQFVWLTTHDCDIVFAQTDYISETGERLGTFAPVFHPEHITREIFLRHLFAHPTAFAKRAVFDERYDEQFMRSQDLDLWLRLMKRDIRFDIVPEVLLKYRLYRNETVEKRIARQRGYAHYGFKVALKHVKNFWASPFFWLFFFKRLGYAAILLVPQSVLALVVRTKDTRRS